MAHAFRLVLAFALGSTLLTILAGAAQQSGDGPDLVVADATAPPAVLDPCT